MNAPPHVARVLGGPLRGTHSTHTLSGQHFGRHWHDAYGFGTLETGAQRSVSGRGRVDAFAGHVITTNPGEVHDGSPLGGLTRRWRILSVDADVFSSLIEHSGAPAEITRPVIDDPTLFDALRRVFRRLERWDTRTGNRAAEALACEEALVESAVRLVTLHGTVRLRTDPPDLDLRRIRDRLADELVDPPSLAEMAAATGLSRYQVLRRFEKMYGLPPHAWLLSRRAEYALRLIRRGETLADAATASGFSDQSHMTRVFVRHHGFTPGAWRRAAAVQ
ncbi:MAG: AraC family transcriptional regulator [Steroidobacteraceae bacterium]